MPVKTWWTEGYDAHTHARARERVCIRACSSRRLRLSASRMSVGAVQRGAIHRILQAARQTFGAPLLVHIGSIMALNVPGVAVMVFFYLLVLGIGIWASVKSKKEAKKGQGDKTEMALLGNRGINLVVGIFTMTGG